VSEVAYSKDFVALLPTRYRPLAILAIRYSKSGKQGIHSAPFPTAVGFSALPNIGLGTKVTVSGW
jgi:hypothetical protein